MLPFLPSSYLPGLKGAAFPFVCGSGEATTGEAGIDGAEEAAAGRGAGEGGLIIMLLCNSSFLIPISNSHLAEKNNTSKSLFNS